ncbi:MAG TPA: AraC family transcriptional regulator [Micromonosporaceae bacterium]
MTAWRPAVPGVTEVFHAHFVDHVYPAHVHAVWTLLIVDDGVIRYDLYRHRHGAVPATVTLLPPYVPHDGRSAVPGGFHKRVLYLDRSVLPEGLVGAAVDRPSVTDRLLRDRIHRLHQDLGLPGEELAAESRLVFVAERLRAHLRRRPSDRPVGPPGVAERLRELLEARVDRGIGLREAADALGAHPTHLVRSFTARYGLPPHRYLTGRRVELARRLLLDGRPPAEAASAAGFYDQAHLTRHFVRHVGVTPGRFARGAGR